MRAGVNVGEHLVVRHNVQVDADAVVLRLKLIDQFSELGLFGFTSPGGKGEGLSVGVIVASPAASPGESGATGEYQCPCGECGDGAADSHVDEFHAEIPSDDSAASPRCCDAPPGSLEYPPINSK